MSDRFLLIGTAYLISDHHFDLLMEVKPKKKSIIPSKYLEKLHKQGNHRRNFSYDLNNVGAIQAKNFSNFKENMSELKPIETGNQNQNTATTAVKRSSSPHFVEDISLIQNKSNTFDNENSSFLEAICEIPPKQEENENKSKIHNDHRKSDINDNKTKNINTPDDSNSKNNNNNNNIKEPTQEKIIKTTDDTINQKEEINKENEIIYQNDYKNFIKTTQDNNNNHHQEENETLTVQNIHSTPISKENNPEKNNGKTQIIQEFKTPDTIKNKNAADISACNTGETVKLEAKPQQKPNLMDKARQRKEEFERKMKEKQEKSNENNNKIKELKEKFAKTPIKEPIIPEENRMKVAPLTPKENLPLPEENKEKSTNFDNIEQQLKQKLAELQKIDTENNEKKSENIDKNSEKETKNVISLKDYRNNLKKTGTEVLEKKPENKYVVNSRGQKINKNLSNIISELENKLSGVYGGDKENNEIKGGQNLAKTTTLPLEHLTLDRSQMGHRRIKSKNTEFLDSL